MTRSAAILGLCLGLAAQALALDPLPFEQKGPGYRTWVVEADHPLVSLEVVLHDLRSTDRRTYLKMLETLGLKQEQQGRGIGWPELVQPVEASAQFLGFERRKMAVVSAPVRGRHLWYAIVLRQEGNEEAYWRARQVFIFETDPVEGLKQGYPDVLGEDIHFWEVRHITQDDIFGRARVSSLFRYDERGRLRITFQEHADAYRPAKFQGESLRVDQTLVYKGDQKIVRKLVLTSYPFMKREEWEQYEGVDPKLAKPAKVQKVEEVFAWDPADFNFYGAAQELEKLAKHKSAYVRRDAARRLGEHMKTTHPGLEKALLTDKDAHVRMQAALALEAIADPAALPTVEKALTNYHEPDEVREALERAQRRLAPLVPKTEPKAEPAAKKKEPVKQKTGQEGGLPKPEGPQVSEKK